MIIYVQRNASGALQGLYTNPQPGVAEEAIDDRDPAVIAFRNPPPTDPMDTWDLITLKLSFAHENRIRALESKAPITVAQFKTAVKAML